jgi:hypothetical protein
MPPSHTGKHHRVGWGSFEEDNRRIATRERVSVEKRLRAFGHCCALQSRGTASLQQILETSETRDATCPVTARDVCLAGATLKDRAYAPSRGATRSIPVAGASRRTGVLGDAGTVVADTHQTLLWIIKVRAIDLLENAANLWIASVPCARVVVIANDRDVDAPHPGNAAIRRAGILIVARNLSEEATRLRITRVLRAVITVIADDRLRNTHAVLTRSRRTGVHGATRLSGSTLAADFDANWLGSSAGVIAWLAGTRKSLAANRRIAVTRPHPIAQAAFAF